MKRTLFVLASIMIVSTMLLTACGGGTVATQAPATTVPTAAAIEPAGQLVIWADETRAPIIEDLADEVLAAYNVELVVELKTSLRDDFQAAAPVGEGPDILFGVAHDQIATIVSNGLLAPIDLGEKAALFAPVAVSACTIGGVLYCMPYATENLGFLYNTDLVPTPPATWDELVTVGEALIAEGKTTYVIAMPGALDYNFYPMMTAFGGYVFGKNADGTWNDQDLGIASPGSVAAVEYFAALAEKGEIPVDFDNAANIGLFETGEAPFVMTGPWTLDRIRDSGVPYAVADFFPAGPEGPGESLAGTQGILINAQSENILLAQTFLNEYIATDETMLKLATAGNRPSAYLPVLEATADPDLAAMGNAGATATMMPNIPAMGAVWGSWGPAVALAIQGTIGAEASLTDAATKINNVINNVYAGWVNVPGSYQAAAGCSADWDPTCELTKMTKGADGLWHSGPFTLVAGDYECKVAMDGAWTVSYGDAAGNNYKFTMAANGTVEFAYDETTHLLTITTK